MDSFHLYLLSNKLWEYELQHCNKKTSILVKKQQAHVSKQVIEEIQKKKGQVENMSTNKLNQIKDHNLLYTLLINKP